MASNPTEPGGDPVKAKERRDQINEMIAAMEAREEAKAEQAYAKEVARANYEKSAKFSAGAGGEDLFKLAATPAQNLEQSQSPINEEMAAELGRLAAERRQATAAKTQADAAEQDRILAGLRAAPEKIATTAARKLLPGEYA